MPLIGASFLKLSRTFKIQDTHGVAMTALASLTYMHYLSESMGLAEMRPVREKVENQSVHSAAVLYSLFAAGESREFVVSCPDPLRFALATLHQIGNDPNRPLACDLRRQAATAAMALLAEIMEFLAEDPLCRTVDDIAKAIME